MYLPSSARCLGLSLALAFFLSPVPASADPEISHREYTDREIIEDLVYWLSSDLCEVSPTDVGDQVGGRIVFDSQAEGSVIADVRGLKDSQGNPRTEMIGGEQRQLYRLKINSRVFQRWRRKALKSTGKKWSNLTDDQKRAALTPVLLHELMHVCRGDEHSTDPFSCGHYAIDFGVSKNLCAEAGKPNTPPDIKKILCEAIKDLRKKWNSPSPPGAADKHQIVANCYCANYEDWYNAVHGNSQDCNCGLTTMPPAPPAPGEGEDPCDTGGGDPPPIDSDPIPPCPACNDVDGDPEEEEETPEAEHPLGGGQ